MDIPVGGAEPVAGGLTSLMTLGEVPVADWAALFVDDFEWYAVDEISHLR